MIKNEKTLHDHLIISRNMLFVGCVVMLSAIFFQSSALFWLPWGLGFFIMIAGVLYRSKFYKCPHCGCKEISMRRVPKYCPDCGKELQ